jgi:4-diphosphocytidyl-2-C-methyl-D-erythritol kinase
MGTGTRAGPAPQYSNRLAKVLCAAAKVRRVLRLGRAPAKLNLALELTGRRADGYHELAAVSQTIDWSDVVAVEGNDLDNRPAPAAPQLQVWGPEAHRVPQGEDNIAVRAAILLRKQDLGAPISRLALEKRIPTQSGLGGGSADAAAVLRLAGAGLDRRQLERIALECGADVPFGMQGGACQLSGIGEVISPLPPLISGAFLIVVLGSVATAAAYAATNPDDFSDGSRVEGLAMALRTGTPPGPELFGSGLQAAAMRAVPALSGRLRELSEASPGVAWAMTGSGGAFFSYQADAESAAVLALLIAPACPGAGIRVALPLAAEAA